MYLNKLINSTKSEPNVSKCMKFYLTELTCISIYNVIYNESLEQNIKKFSIEQQHKWVLQLRKNYDEYVRLSTYFPSMKKESRIVNNIDIYKPTMQEQAIKEGNYKRY